MRTPRARFLTPGGAGLIPDLAPHTFLYIAESRLRTVNVAGTFNGWNRTANPMKVDADGRTWRFEARLPYGKVQYKFVVDGDKWITDPKNKDSETDASGNTNSVLLITPLDYRRPASPLDGEVAQSALLHERGGKWLNYDQGKLSVRLRTRPGDLKKVSLVVNGKVTPMTIVSSDLVYATYGASLEWNRKTDLRYRFAVVDGEKKLSFGPTGLRDGTFEIKAKEFRPFLVPDWVERGVIYQIFPDRFANGDTKNDDPKTEAWDGKPTWFNTFGGDTAGVRKHLSHLKGLGIGSVYFNPVFKSPSVHRYDATDFKLIDPKFGTNAEFASLTRDMRKAGIRTIMDFAFNHTAVDFAPFLDLRTNGENSTYKNWYWIKSYPVIVKDNPPYEAWYGFPSMPKLNVMNPQTHDYVLSVIDFWKRNGSLDGIRLDVANEVDPQMWRDLRAHVKSSSPDTWILGEEWGDASAWLMGDQWDASMNYPFRSACLGFFARGETDSKSFLGSLMSLYNQYAPQVSRNQLNPLSTHDTARFLTECKGDQGLANLAAIFQMTWVGTPSIYYGDELGMEGGADPDNRRGMRWDLASDSNATLQLYRKLILTRNSSRELQSGEPIPLANEGKAFAFARKYRHRSAIVGMNRGSQPSALRLTIPAGTTTRRFVDVLSGQTYVADQSKLFITLPPMSAVILLPSVASPSSRKSAQYASVRRNQLT